MCHGSLDLPLLFKVNKNLCLLSLFLLFWDLKKVPWIALLRTANFEQVIIINYFASFEKAIVISHFANFEQVKKHSSDFANFGQVIIKIIILLTLNRSKNSKSPWEKPDDYVLLFFLPIPFSVIPHSSMDYCQVFRPILYFQPSPSQSD